MLQFFRLIAALEGISYLALFYNMLYNKSNNFELYQKLLYPIGMAHGILFVLYVVLAIYLKFEYNWSIKKTFLVLLASLLPFGTFYSDYKWIKS